jgi:streptogramin lyase
MTNLPMLKSGAARLTLVAAVLALALPARGEIQLYAQPSDFPNSSAISSQTDTNGVGDPTTAYDDFTLANAATITRITWRGGYVLPANPVAISTFTVTFYGTTGAGEPDTATVLNENIVPGNAGETLVGTNTSKTIRMFDYQLTLPTPFAANAGTKYWMSIMADKNGTLPQWGWGTGTGGDGIMYADAVTGRRRLTFDLAFTLRGTNAPPPPNTPPILAAISNRTVYANTLLSFPVSATDTDQPPQTLTFSLLPGAPPAATISSSGGVFNWTPAVGPATAPISVKVTDNGSPPLAATQSFTVFVLAANTPPVLAAIPDQTVIVNTLLSFTASATDTDQPPQTLTFSLEPGYPTGASITPGGVFSWTPTNSQAPGSYPIAVKVADDGVPSLTATQRFSVTVMGVSLGIDVGDIVVAGYSDNKVFKFNSSSGALQFLGDFVLPTDVALASNGDLYISEAGGAIQRLNLKNGTVTRVNTNTALVDYWGITLGPSGDLFVANSTEDRVVRIDPVTGHETVLSESNLLSSPYGIDVLDPGHLVVSSLNNSRIVSIALADGAQTLIAETNGMVSPWGVAVHGTNLYVGDPGAMSVFKIAHGVVASLWATTNLPSGIAVETNGNILAGSAAPGEVVRLDPQGNVLHTYSNPLLTMVAGVEVSRIHVGPDNQVHLTILLTPTNTVVVAWPSPSPGYVLQHNSACIQTNWVNTTNTVNVVNGQNQVLISPPTEKCFYRLFHP